MLELETQVESVVQETELLDLVQHGSCWQWVIHGATEELRSMVVQVLLEAKGLPAAKRYALCGCGDEMRTDQQGNFRIVPHGCGERLCPRCSRKRGVKFLRKVEERLATCEHKYLYHMVLTQQVHRHEALKDSAARFEAKWRLMLVWLKRAGMVAGLGTIHVNWSRFQGWHYHLHVFMETIRATSADQIELVWWRLLSDLDQTVTAAPSFLREVAQPGPPLSELEGTAGETELWKEAGSALGKALQYPLRDILAGMSSWTLGRAGLEQIRELIEGTKGLQSHRTYGSWRLKDVPPAEEELEAGVDRLKTEEETQDWLSLGTMDEIQKAALCGAQWCMMGLQWLERNVRNDSKFGERLVSFCRAVIPF